MEERLVTEVPSSLKQLARLVVRGFYTIEDALIVDMLVRNPCMKEDDICDLLKFERKMLRARISTLKSDKFIQVRLRMETGTDGKAQKVNYYFINYKTFVNVVKYKLDLMRKRLETEERDATSRASFKCLNCLKTFTDLEADQLFDFMTGEFRCTYCREVVEEDSSALPKKDSRLLLAKFNEQLDPLYILLREVEGIKLAPEVLEPEPVDIGVIRGVERRLGAVPPLNVDLWSGEATRNIGFMVEETRVDINIGDGVGGGAHDGASGAASAQAHHHKEAPIWMMESTVITTSTDSGDKLSDGILMDNSSIGAGGADASNVPINSNAQKTDDDIMSVLLMHEKKHQTNAALALKSYQKDSDSSSDDGLGGPHKKKTFEDVERIHSDGEDISNIGNINDNDEIDDDEEGDDNDADDDDDDDEGNVPTVNVGTKVYCITDINDTIIADMTQAEKEIYVQVFQDYYSHMNY